MFMVTRLPPSSGRGAQLPLASAKMQAAHPADTVFFRSSSVFAVGTAAFNAVSSASVHLPTCGATGSSYRRYAGSIGSLVGQPLLEPSRAPASSFGGSGGGGGFPGG